MPDYLLDYNQVAEKQKMKNLNLSNVEIKASQIPDDMPLMSKMNQAGFLVSTPS